MENLSKGQVKVRLAICMVIGAIGFIVMKMVAKDAKDLQAFYFIVGPVLMAVGMIPCVFVFTEYVKKTFEFMFDMFLMVMLAMTLQFGKAFEHLKSIFRCGKWYFGTIGKAIKKTFWAFSGAQDLK